MATRSGQAAAPDPRELNKAYSDLIDDLNEAYWAASTLEAKDRLKGIIDIVTEALVELDAADLATRDDAYNALVAQVNGVNTQLQTLQKQINDLISRINTAATIIADISKVLTTAANLFPAI